MAWFNEGLSSLKGQITNLTKDIVVPNLLTDSNQDGTETAAHKHVDQIEEKCKYLEQEVERLKLENAQLRQLDGSLQSSISSPEVATLDCEVPDDDFDDSFQTIGWGDDVWTDSFLGQDGEELGDKKAKEVKREDEIANLQKQVNKLLLDKRKLKQRCVLLDSQVELLSEQLGKATKVDDSKQCNHQEIQTTENSSNYVNPADFSRLQQEIMRLQEERTQLRTELAAMTRVVQDLESQVRVSQDENANLTTGLEELDIQHQEAIEQMMSVKETTQKRLEVLSVEFEELKTKYDELKIISETKKETIDMNLQTVDVELTSKQESSLIAAHEKSLCIEIQKLIHSSVPNELFEQHESIDSVLDLITVFIKFFNNTFKEKNDNDSKVAELSSKLQEMEDEMDALEHENSGLQSSVERLTKQCETLQPIPENSEELEALDHRINTLEKEVTVLREVRSNLEVELDLAKNTVSDLTLRLQTNEAMIRNQDNLQNEIALMQANERSLRDELEALKRIKGVVEDENIMLKQKTSNNDELRNQLEKSLEHYRKEIEKETSKSKLLSEETQALKEDNKKLKKELLSITDSCKEKERKSSESDMMHSNDIKRIALMEAKCMELDEIIVTLKIENESKERKMCELILEKSTSDKHLEELKKSQECENDEIINLKKNYAVKDTEINNLKLKIKEINENYNKEINSLSNEKNDLSLLIAELNSQLSDKSFEVDELNLKIQQIEVGIVQQLETKYLEKTAECNLFKERFSELERTTTELKQLLTKSEEEKLTNLEKLNTERTSEQSLLQQRYSQLEFNLNELNNKLVVSENEKYSAIEKIKKENEIEYLKLREKCTEMEGLIANMELQLKSSEEEKQSLAEKLNTIISELNDKSDCLQKISDHMKQTEELKMKLENECEKYKNELELMQREGEKFEKNNEKHEMALDSISRLSQVVADREKENSELKEMCKSLQDNVNQQVPKLLDERDQLIKSLQSKHMEGLEYHNEIQRLNKLLSDELNKTTKFTSDVSQLNKMCLEYQQQIQEKEENLRFQDREMLNLRQQVETLQSQLEYASQLLRVADRQEAEGQPSTECTNATLSSASIPEQDKEYVASLERERNELAENLLKEQTRSKYLQNEAQEHHEKEMGLTKEIERLRNHLVAVEENYTHEMVKAEEQVKDLQLRISQADERVKNSSTAYTSASIRANQQVETLQAQSRLLTEQRDKIQLLLSASEDKIQKQAAALTNLQIVLEQFQRDKERDISLETERIKQTLQQAYQKNDGLKIEIQSLQCQLKEAKEGLSAASRLGEQIERKDLRINDLNTEVKELTEKLNKMDEKIKAANTGVEGKVDRYLVKNLLVGYLSAPQQNRQQALRVLATVVDLSQDERQRIGLEASTNADTLQQQSLSEAFVRFLENESRPQAPLKLPLSGITESTSNESRSRRSSSVLLPDVLPSIPQFAPGRSSGSILKDVLKDDRL